MKVFTSCKCCGKLWQSKKIESFIFVNVTFLSHDLVTNTSTEVRRRAKVTLTDSVTFVYVPV